MQALEIVLTASNPHVLCDNQLHCLNLSHTSEADSEQQRIQSAISFGRSVTEAHSPDEAYRMYRNAGHFVDRDLPRVAAATDVSQGPSIGPSSAQLVDPTRDSTPLVGERRSLSELKGRHSGADIWLIAAGASMNHVDPGFFDGKLTLGVNAVHRRFRCDYLVIRTMVLAEEACRSGASIIMTEHEMGRLRAPRSELPVMAWYFPHLSRALHEPIDLSVVGSDQIVVGASIIVSAIHVAAYLGARNIILCGHDCGSLDGQIAFEGYYDEVKDPIGKWRMLNRMEEQTVAVREKLAEVYGCRVYSLNPFVNFGLEKHVYRREP